MKYMKSIWFLRFSQNWKNSIFSNHNNCLVVFWWQ